MTTLSSPSVIVAGQGLTEGRGSFKLVVAVWGGAGRGGAERRVQSNSCSEGQQVGVVHFDL